MKTSREYRTLARAGLKGEWATAIGTTIVAGLLGGSGTVPVVSSKAVDYIHVSPAIEKMIYFAAIVSIVYVIIRMLFGGSIRVGYSQYTLNVLDRDNPQFKDIFSCMDRWGQGFLLELLTDIFVLLWSLLLIVPGIMKAYSYCMAPYLMAENSELTALEAITESKKLMKGHRWQLFCLQFSFIGWILLCVVTLGIALLWIQPYESVSVAAFYRELTQKEF